MLTLSDDTPTDDKLIKPGADPDIEPGPDVAADPDIEPGKANAAIGESERSDGATVEAMDDAIGETGGATGVLDDTETAAAAITDPLHELTGRLQGRRCVVVGLGISGLAMARWLHRQGAKITVLDDRVDPPGREALTRECPGATLHAGPFDAAQIEHAELVCWSPGLSPYMGTARALFEAAQHAAVPVVGELELFSGALAVLRLDGYQPRIVAITGTNGKTTVTELMAVLARSAGLDAQAAGNIGPSLLDALRTRLDEDRLPAFWSLELSSFQLAFGHGIACDAAVVLNVTQDHFDWHPTPAHYRECKLSIHRHARTWIINDDDEATDPTPPPPTAPLPQKGRRIAKAPRPLPPHAQIHFGLRAPRSASDFGIALDGGLEWLVEAVAEAHEGSTRRRGAQDPSFHLSRLMPTDALRIRGAHNQSNALAALALGRAAGLSMAAMLRALREFHAAAHRCAPVLVLNEVEYIDDSKGTNVGATVAALNGIGRRCVLIAGGLGKGQDFSPLAESVRRHARAVVLIGRDRDQIRAALMETSAGNALSNETGLDLVDATDMQDAVKQAAARALPGDAVLLSPACASMDMFRNYAHRAEVFIDAVRGLADEAGQPC